MAVQDKMWREGLSSAAMGGDKFKSSNHQSIHSAQPVSSPECLYVLIPEEEQPTFGIVKDVLRLVLLSPSSIYPSVHLAGRKEVRLIKYEEKWKKI